MVWFRVTASGTTKRAVIPNGSAIEEGKAFKVICRDDILNVEHVIPGINITDDVDDRILFHILILQDSNV